MTGLCARVTVGCLLVGMTVIGYAETPSTSSLQAGTVLAEVRAQGARAVVAALWSNNDQWNQVMGKIGRGAPEWLQVAVALRPGTDAGASETLEEAVFLALKVAPVAVLKLLKEGTFETNVVCSSNIGTDYPPAKSRRLIRDRIKVLTGLSDPNVLATRDQCVTGLRAALADFDRPQ